MKSVEITACNCEQIVLSVQPNGDCTAKKVSNTETEVSITAIETVLSDYVGKKKVEKLAKAIAEVIDTSSNADKAQVVLVWKDGTKYCISDDESGQPKLVELKEESSNLKDEIRGIAEDYIDEDEMDEFLERAAEAITTIVMANDTPAYMPKGFKYLDGSIESKNYRIVDEQGNVFTWVPERIIGGKLVKEFYVSTYEISEGDDGTPRSVEGEIPWVRIGQSEAIEQAKKFGGRLLDGPEWDAICEECAEIIGGTKVYEDSTYIGNYWNNAGSNQALEKTTGKHVICGISNLAGNCWTWTNENYGKFTVIRGGSYMNNGNNEPMASYNYINTASRSEDIGFRIVL